MKWGQLEICNIKGLCCRYNMVGAVNKGLHISVGAERWVIYDGWGINRALCKQPTPPFPSRDTFAQAAAQHSLTRDLE